MILEHVEHNVLQSNTLETRKKKNTEFRTCLFSHISYNPNFHIHFASNEWANETLINTKVCC